MNIYNKKKKLVISAILFILCFISADFTRAAETGKNTRNNRSYFYYTIKKGDTLWDISQKFYNSNWVWPGLWGINKQIQNPHLIYPGKKIKIFLRETIKEQKSIPHVKKPKATVKHQLHPTFYYPGMEELGFIKKESVRPLGRIIKSESNNIMISKGDIIYIEPLGNNPMIPGKKYRIFNTEKISHIYKHKRFHGVKHSIKGIIEILSNKGEYLTARIIRSFHFASEGDMIMDYKKPAYTIKVRDVVKNINARLICAENGNTLISSHTIAFINRGSNSRIKPGQLYNIFQKQENRKSPVSGRKILLPPLKIGRLIVLKTERTASTVLILSAKKTINPGDIVR